MRCLLVWMSNVLMLVYGSTLPAVAGTDDLDALLAGVAEIGAPGVPGPLCVYGPEAFPVIVGRTWEGSFRAPVVAAGRWQAGRVVILGHGGYFDRATLDAADTGRFMTNALRWAAGAGTQDGPRIGVVSDVGRGELRDWLTTAGQDAVDIGLVPGSLGAVDVVALEMWNQSIPELRALQAFVRGGGGLITASTAWGWAQLHPDLDLVNDYAGNHLLAPIGIQWPYDWLHRTSPEGYSVDDHPAELTHAGKALDAVEAHAAGTRVLTQPEIDQATDSLIRTVGCLPPDDTLLAPRLRALVEENDHWPSAEQPVTRTDTVPRLAAGLFAVEHRRTPAESVRAHPAADDFPGPVPADAPRLERSLTVDTTVPRWHSTGLYAAPGELVTVTVPAEAAKVGGFHVRIGAHSDGIWGRPEWTRMPEISRRFPVSAVTTRVANAFGGLIYIEVPAEIPDDADLGSIVVEIEGAVAAPHFVRGETDPTAWRHEIRHAPAPWAEIAGRNMIVATDAREVRELDDPAAIARTWDRVLDLSAELAAWPSLARTSPERFVVDRQISVGYMHAGYPLMAHMDQSAHLVDAQHISTCRDHWTGSNWGFFHEVGHNHQNYDWTFDGTVEVTVNLFTLYVFEHLCGRAANGRWPSGSGRSWAEEMARYDFDNPDFELWKREPFLALIMYAQMQQAFGWEPYRAVFAEYLALPDDERPKSDAGKRDQWLVRFSRTVGRNLGPFFETWGVPTSPAARDSIADLPEWMPPNFPPAPGQATSSNYDYLPHTPSGAQPAAGETMDRGPVPDYVSTAADGTGFQVETVVTGLQAPMSLDFAPDGRLFVVERKGRVWVFQSGQLPPDLALDVGRDDARRTELLDLALDPEFSDNGFVYVLQAEQGQLESLGLLLVRYREFENSLAQAAVLLTDLPVAAPPATARIRFGPDGLLYVALGGARDADEAQDLASYAGKILRIRKDGTLTGANPFASPVYSLGHRHPGGFDWHPLTGTLWAAEPGDTGYDEINRVVAGGNYGWPNVWTSPGVRAPAVTLWPLSVPAGASFYTGPATITGFRNDLFIAALDGAHLRRIRFDPSDPSRIIGDERLLDGRFGRLRDVVTGPDGGLYVATGNRDGYGMPTEGDDRIIRLMPMR